MKVKAPYLSTKEILERDDFAMEQLIIARRIARIGAIGCTLLALTAAFLTFLYWH